MNDQIFPSNLALEALKSGPYKNTAYAISELIDNSADAKATEIGVVAFVEREGAQPHTIAVLDNGCGMDKTLLRHCIQYGYGNKSNAGEIRGRSARRNRSQRRAEGRLGKFGVGLVAASCTQCSDLEVISWQGGEPELRGDVPSVRLSLSMEDKRVKNNVLPTPTKGALPGWAASAFVGMPTHVSEMKSGTLVVWRNLDPTWRRARTLQRNLLDLCGRIHREFIRMKILLISVNIFDESSGKVIGSELALPVDPTFLTNWDTYHLKDYGFEADETLFVPFTGHVGDSGKNFDGDYEDDVEDVLNPANGEVLGSYYLTASFRSKRTVEDEELTEKHDDPGDAPYGKLAKKLQGVSILRAGREISLDPAWLRVSKSVDRWLSVSLDFDPELDDLFGVSNDKQQARDLAALAPMSIQDIRDELKSIERGGMAEDWKYRECLEVALKIKRRLQNMQSLVKKQRKGQRTGGPHDSPQVDDPVVAPVSELIDQSKTLPEGSREISIDSVSPSSDPKKTADVYGDSMSGNELARDVRPQNVIKHSLKLDYARDPFSSGLQMFHVALGTGHMVVHFHEKHPLSGVLANLMLGADKDDEEDFEPATMQDALRVIRGLMASFARIQVEAEEYDDEEAAQLHHCLLTWSKKAAYVFRNDED